MPDCLVQRVEQDQDAMAPSGAHILSVVLYSETLGRVNVLHLGDNHGNEPEGPLSALRHPHPSGKELPPPAPHGMELFLNSL